MLAKEQNDWRDDVGEGDFVVLYYGAELFYLEFGHYDCCQAAVHGLMYLACEACDLMSKVMCKRGTKSNLP